MNRDRTDEWGVTYSANGRTMKFVNNRFNEPVTYLTGSIYFKEFETGNTVLSTSISKTIHKVNDATIVSFLDPITYAYQVVLL